MKLTQDNYYGEKANREYMSASQFKDFLKCEAMAMAKIKGEYTEKTTTALLLGSYIDAYFTDDLEEFIEKHPEIISSRGATKGELKTEYKQADETITLIKKQPLMMKYLSGEHQKIMTGEIEGVPFKIRMDSYKPNEFICDLKYMRSLRSPNLFEPMIKYWRYDIQAAIYQEIVSQNTGKTLPFVFAVATKETPAHLEIGYINNLNLENALDEVKQLAPRYQKIKNGEIEAERCEAYECEWCTSTRIITELIDTDMFGMRRIANG